ncbi:MAG: hypoxanthine phosphoribosyltransferase [Muribaculaceae bacterium]
MKKITLQGLEFEPYITKQEIAAQVKRVANEITEDLDGDDAPLFICVLNGAFIFAADLYREVNLPHSQITFIRFKSYDGMETSGEIRQILGLQEDITGRNIIIIEDIVDTGSTAAELISLLSEHGPKSVRLATLLFKPNSIINQVLPDYVGFNIPSKFIIGYGLDLDEEARNLSDIYILSSDKDDDDGLNLSM